MTRIITDATVAATLRVAATVLDVQGWHRGDYSTDIHDPHGLPCCVLGAIAVACGLPATAWEEDPQDVDAILGHRLMVAAAGALGRRIGYLGELDEAELAEHVGDWNDRQTSADDVLRALRESAEEVDLHGAAA